MIALPACLRDLGLCGGLTLLLLTPFFADHAIFLITSSADLSGHDTYQAMAKHALGIPGAAVTAYSLVLLNFGICCSYAVVIKELLPNVLRAVLGLSERPPSLVCLGLIGVTMLAPLTALPSMDQMKSASLICVALTLALVVVLGVVAARGPLSLLFPGEGELDGATMDASYPELTMWKLEGLGPLLKAIPIESLSYMCHMNIPFLYQELRRQAKRDTPSRYGSKREKFQIASRTSLAICTALYVVQAVSGYVAFGDATKTDILANFAIVPSASCTGACAVLPPPATLALHAAFVAVMVATFPSCSFGLRRTLFTMVCGPDAKERPAQRYISAAVITAVVCATANATSDLGVIMALVGSTTGCMLMFVLPSAIFLGSKRVADAEVAARDAALGGSSNQVTNAASQRGMGMGAARAARGHAWPPGEFAYDEAPNMRVTLAKLTPRDVYGAWAMLVLSVLMLLACTASVFI